jgi:rsbT co-antagonist protein RsbR
LIYEVSTPVVPVCMGVLILPIIGSLDTARMQRATEAALNEVMRTSAHSCIIDITGARIIDSYAVTNLNNLVSALRLIGAEAIVTGVTAHAAQTLVGLGVDFTGMKTRRTLAEALASIIKSQTQVSKDGDSINGFTEKSRRTKR